MGDGKFSFGKGQENCLGFHHEFSMRVTMYNHMTDLHFQKEKKMFVHVSKDWLKTGEAVVN